MTRQYTLILDEQEHNIDITREGEDFLIRLGETSHRFRPLFDKNPLYSFSIDNSKILEAEISFNKDACDLNIGHVPYHLEVFDPRRRLFSQGEAVAGAGGGLITAPMPGKVVDVKVKLGDTVKKGTPLVVVEAMKMQNELLAPCDGVIAEIAVKAGDTVESGQKLLLVMKEGK
ncbi:MAG: biotin/lipoyl-binding protein [Deltaproteobacteria bacterium]|nr:biotin/lipoyl-binding protein [Deltaproteobacteria bacterium]